jgi:rhodanese-related sulfurtransferase
MKERLYRALALGFVLFGATTSVFGAGLDRTAQAGGVAAVAAPINISDATATTIDFKIALDTHSVPLTFDVQKIAFLGDGKDTPIAASRWSGGKGGHHLSGTLSFDAVNLGSFPSMVLTLRGAGGGKDLDFTWAGPFPVSPTKASSIRASFSNIAPQKLALMLKNKDFFLVNTHVPYAGEIASTDAFVPYDETASRLKDFPADKNAKIVLYCRSGRMSEIAAKVLSTAGYTNVENLEGGMIAWEEAGLGILDKWAERAASQR